jgi:hypothetical protein
MKLVITINLGNDAMRTWRHVMSALRSAITKRSPDREIELLDDGKIKDENGNTVGSWEVFK